MREDALVITKILYSRQATEWSNTTGCKDHEHCQCDTKREPRKSDSSRVK
jgi:hypothetical protein